MRWLLVGDSLSVGRGATVYDGREGGSSPGAQLARLLAVDGEDVTVSARGGRSFRSLWAGTPLLPPEGERFDALVTLLGTNDAANLAVGGGLLRADMERLIARYPGARAIAVGPPAFINPVGVGSPRRMVDLNAAAERVYATLREAFPKVIDARPMTLDTLTPAQGRGADGIHFAGSGAVRFADRLYGALTGRRPMRLIWAATAARNSGAGRAFLEKVVEVSHRLGIDPNHLMAAMKVESGFSPRSVNPSSGASGLIQFLSEPERVVGHSLAEIRRMGALDQLDLVERYFRKAAGGRRLSRLEDVYQAIYGPAYIGQPEKWSASNRQAQGWVRRAYEQGLSGADGSLVRSSGGSLALAAGLSLAAIGALAWALLRR